MRYLITLIFTCFLFQSKGQNLLGSSKDEIKTIAKEEKWTITETKSINGIPMIEVYQDTNNIKFYFFDSSNICKSYVVFYGDKTKQEIEDVLNKVYAKGDDFWYTDAFIIKIDYDSILGGYFVKFKKN